MGMINVQNLYRDIRRVSRREIYMCRVIEKKENEELIKNIISFIFVSY
jgi:hypothetical protein